MSSLLGCLWCLFSFGYIIKSLDLVHTMNLLIFENSPVIGFQLLNNEYCGVFGVK